MSETSPTPCNFAKIMLKGKVGMALPKTCSGQTKVSLQSMNTHTHKVYNQIGKCKDVPYISTTLVEYVLAQPSLLYRSISYYFYTCNSE